ncbi:MAG: polyphosphate kinase 1 [Gammaproteobacteria bacterium]|nr:polyphosphate kinase 1 [Gammaproteobacteria bacterium]MDH5304838.1 polyphosphate kinase 1 [Gammaproteobacteria bacterium]MDH5322456.1 polyphosphate kinase 1 [Gammaproteobacteria bacterium]
MDAPAQPPTDLYINRELSQLEFNKRVFAQALDPTVPLLERLRFLCITCTNLDEFFEIRVAVLKQQIEIGAPTQGPDKLTAQQVFDALRHQTLSLVQQQYQFLNNVLLPELAAAGVRFIESPAWSEEQRLWLHDYFLQQVVPVLTPLTFDPSRPFPRVLNKSLNFIVRLEGKDAFGRRRHRGVVQAPRSLPRVIRLPDHLSNPDCHDYVFLSSIIREHIDELFPGLEVGGCYQFRITRNSNLYVDDEEVSDLVHVLEGQLEASRYGAAVRIEVGHECPADLQQFLLDHFQLQAHDMYLVRGPVNLNRLATVCDIEDRPELKYPVFTPGHPKELLGDENIFSILAKKNVLLHHPYQSFAPTIDFIYSAATDANVLAIKMTLYRTGPESPIVDHLVRAARSGKEVTVIIELMARFDEAANISLANRLQEAGAHVVYGLVGYKTHAKMTLVVRREKDQLRRYVHLGTGNYHHATTRVYTDYGYMSSSRRLGEDVHRVFMQLTSLTAAGDLSRMLTAPFTLYEALTAKIRRETEIAKAGGQGRIIVKINSLSEAGIINTLYEASAAGVQIDLIVRGICTLRPGVPGLSENIRVRSIVGRFLEHSRVYFFGNNGDGEFYCSSADWMERNLLKRNESCFEIRQKAMKDQIMHDLELFLADNCQAWTLHGDGSYERLQPGEKTPISAQEVFLKLLASPN